jgi:uncharacterized membrane protein YdfJ with MMPL/SSD domain
LGRSSWSSAPGSHPTHPLEDDARSGAQCRAGVGVGVDYGIYIFARLKTHLEAGHDFATAYLMSLRETGTAVVFTGLTLAIGVSTWIFSDLKFQADMGLLLTFMFATNMLAAVTLIPALGVLLERIHPWQVAGKAEPTPEP